MEICYYTTNLQYIMQYISIITLINSVIQDTQQIMTGQFDLSGTCPNDTEPLPNLTADFSVITFQHDCILLGGRNMIKTKVIQQSGKVARVSVSRSLHPVNIRLCRSRFFFAGFLLEKSPPSSSSSPPLGKGGLGRMFSLLSFSFLFMRLLFVAVSGDSVTVSRVCVTISGVSATASGRVECTVSSSGSRQ